MRTTQWDSETRLKHLNALAQDVRSLYGQHCPHLPFNVAMGPAVKVACSWAGSEDQCFGAFWRLDEYCQRAIFHCFSHVFAWSVNTCDFLVFLKRLESRLTRSGLHGTALDLRVFTLRLRIAGRIGAPVVACHRLHRPWHFKPDSLEAAQISALYLPFVAMMAGFLDVEDEIHIDPQGIERVWSIYLDLPSFATQQQVSRVARLQVSRVPRFQSFRLPGFQGFVRVFVFFQQRNDQRHAKRTQNTIELLQFVKKKHYHPRQSVNSTASQGSKVQSFSQGLQMLEFQGSSPDF